MSDGLQLETHPDWGDRVALFNIMEASNGTLGQWYETGDSMGATAWADRHVYTTTPMAPVDSNGTPIDFVLDFSSATKATALAFPSGTLEKFAMRDTWVQWQDGQQRLNKTTDTGVWSAIYLIYDAAFDTKTSTWSPTGDLLGVMGVHDNSKGTLTWWMPGDLDSGPTLDATKIGLSPTSVDNLYFQAQLSPIQEKSPQECWYLSGDDPDVDKSS